MKKSLFLTASLLLLIALPALAAPREKKESRSFLPFHLLQIETADPAQDATSADSGPNNGDETSSDVSSPTPASAPEPKASSTPLPTPQVQANTGTASSSIAGTLIPQKIAPEYASAYLAISRPAGDLYAHSVLGAELTERLYGIASLFASIGLLLLRGAPKGKLLTLS